MTLDLQKIRAVADAPWAYASEDIRAAINSALAHPPVKDRPNLQELTAEEEEKLRAAFEVPVLKEFFDAFLHRAAASKFRDGSWTFNGAVSKAMKKPLALMIHVLRPDGMETSDAD